MIKTIFNNYKLLLGTLVLLLVVFLAYGKILGMYFFLEDYLILYSIQNPSSPDAGYGTGIIGRPFGWAVTPFIPFYHLFKLEPFGYYFVELILYFVTTLAVYFFTKTLTNNKKASFGAALIFASGYVGSGSVYRMAVGWQNLLAAIFISLSVALYFKYIKTPTLKYYLLAFSFYLFTSEFSFYRAHGIILLILGIELLFNFSFLKSIIRMLPYVASYWYFYVYSLPFMDQGSKTASFFRIVFQEGNYHYLLTPFKTLENLFIPDKFHLPFLVFAAALAAILIWKRSKVLIYCLLFALANFFVHFYNSPSSVPETVHRYLTVSFVGIAAFWGVLLNSVFKSSNKYFLVCLLIVLLNITLARQEQDDILQNRSKPNREFWQSFLREIKTIPANSVIYIDTKNDGVSKPVRDTSLSAGSMSATASFAVFYRLKWDELYLAENFSEILSLVKAEKAPKDNIFTFFYSRQDGLINTTSQTKRALSEGDTVKVQDLNDIQVKYSSPLLLTFSSETNINPREATVTPISGGLKQYLDYLSARNDYYKIVSINTNTEVKYAEVRNIKDDNIETSWRADDTKWAANHHEEIIIDLGNVKNIGAVKVKPGHMTRVPIKYTYECSLDSQVWNKLADIEKVQGGIDEYMDKFNNGNCRYFKLVITNTISGPPQISEIEVIDAMYSEIDFGLANKIEENPFLYSLDTLLLANYFAKSGINGKVCIYTDKYKSSSPKCVKHNFKYGTAGDSVLIDQGGNILQKIEFKLPENININFKNPLLKYLTYEELEKMGYIFP